MLVGAGPSGGVWLSSLRVEPHRPFGTDVAAPQRLLAAQLQHLTAAPQHACPANRLPRPLDGLALKMEPPAQRGKRELGGLGGVNNPSHPSLLHEPHPSPRTTPRPPSTPLPTSRPPDLPTPPPKQTQTQTQTIGSILLLERRIHGPTISCGSAVREALPTSNATQPMLRLRCTPFAQEPIPSAIPSQDITRS
jgi:hypothetical protein